MKIRNSTFRRGDLILNIVDDEDRLLGNFIVCDKSLIKELRVNDLSRVEMAFKYANNV